MFEREAARIALGVIGGAASVGLLVAGHLAYSGHYKKVGRLACEAKIDAANAETVDVTTELGTKKDEADNVYDAKTNEIRTETITGITAIDLARAQREAQNTGEELGRAQAIAEYRAAGGCLSEPLSSDDGLLVVGQDQQRAIFGRVIGSDENVETETVRQDP